MIPLDKISKMISMISGCTFASLDAETKPSAGIRKVTEGERVLLFNMAEGSGYENMVKRRLIEEGLDPNSFSVGELPWGERVDGPIICARGRYYLQTILLKPGRVSVYIGKMLVPQKDVPFITKHRHSGNQGLVNPVIVSTYALDSLIEIRLLGEKVNAES